MKKVNILVIYLVSAPYKRKLFNNRLCYCRSLNILIEWFENIKSHCININNILKMRGRLKATSLCLVPISLKKLDRRSSHGTGRLDSLEDLLAEETMQYI